MSSSTLPTLPTRKKPHQLEPLSRGVAGHSMFSSVTKMPAIGSAVPPASVPAPKAPMLPKKKPTHLPALELGRLERTPESDTELEDIVIEPTAPTRLQANASSFNSTASVKVAWAEPPVEDSTSTCSPMNAFQPR